MDITMKFGNNKTNMKCEDNQNVSSKDNVQLVKETIGLQSLSKKTPVLPKSLLLGVTELVKSQKVDLSHRDNIQVSGNELNNQNSLEKNAETKTDALMPDLTIIERNINMLYYNGQRVMEEVSKAEDSNQDLNETVLRSADGSTSDVPCGCTENSLSADDAGVNVTQNSVDVDFDNLATITDNLFEMVENKAVPFQNLDKEQEMETADMMYNLPDLFSGALEQQKNYERKRSNRKRKANMSRQWSKKTSRKFKEKQDMTDEADDHKEANSEMKYTEIKDRTLRPNYFVALQISEPTIQATLQKLQDAMILGNNMLKPALIKLSSLHLTLMVLRIDTDEEMNRCRLGLDFAAEQLRPCHSSHLALDICGIGNFRNEVVFAKVSNEEQATQLQHIADVIEECMLNQEITSLGNHTFKPHLTIMKLSKVKRVRTKAPKKIDTNLYEDYVDMYFGSQLVSTIQLCAMNQPMDKHGYYQVVHQVQFTNATFEEISNDAPAEVIALQTSSSIDNSDTFWWANSSLALISEKEFVEELDRTVYNDIVTIHVKDDICQKKISEFIAPSEDNTKNVKME